MITQEREEIKEALKRMAQQQYDFQQMVDAKTASLADVGPNKSGDLDLEQKWLQDMSQQIEGIQKQVNKVAEKVYSNELNMDKLEQYSRSNGLIFHGCTDAPPGNDYEAFVNHVINKLNSKLTLPTNLQNSDVDICHSLPSRSIKKPIIIKFVRRSMRNMVFFNKRS